MINLLLEKGARPNGHKTSPLVVASYNGNKICCEKLIEVGANVNEMTIEGLRPLVAAILTNQLDIALLLLQSGADVNCSYKDLTALDHAVGQNQLNLVQLLLQLISRGANPNQKDNNSVTPLHLASSQKFSELIKLLVNHGANVNSLNGNNQTPLHLSCQVGEMDDAEFLIKSGARLDLVDESGKTPTEYAVGKVHKGGFENGGVLKKLQKLGADLDLPDDDGFRLLHKASKAGDSDVVSYLLNSEVDVDSETREGLPPIFYAVYGNHKEIVLQLLEHSCKVNVQDSSGNTLLHIAVANGCQEIVKYLLKADCSVNDQNESGNTALHLAAKSSSYGSCKILLEAGANQDILNCEDASPLELVNPEENKDLVYLFRSISSPDSNDGLSKN
ncbi:unnamed protein product [Tenebrio molitor]|nr:unnamed protein product [Tenebrio molitor]